jgi:hypothetical protein
VDIVDLEEISEGGDISRMLRAYKQSEGGHGQEQRRIGTQRSPDLFPVPCVNICKARKGERAQCASAISLLCNIPERAENAVPDGHRQRRIGPGQVRRFQVELRCPTGSRARNKDYGACEPTDVNNVDTTFARGQLPFASWGYHPFRQFGFWRASKTLGKPSR